MPWNVTLGDGVTIGDRAHVYALGAVTIGAETTVAQEAYLCAGTHDFSDPGWPLLTPPIAIGRRCFLGLRTVVLPRVTICDGVLLGANSLVSRDISEPGTYAGQPVKKLSGVSPC
jgi:putative colanic acid biosynthesis acetyltransferase WcaF